MSDQVFHVEEIAIFVREGSRYYGMEVTITKPLHHAVIRDRRDGLLRPAWVYGIDGDFERVPGQSFAAEPHDLRKRRPPQDWQSLCNLKEHAPERELEIA